MQLVLNGESHDYPHGITIADLLKRLGLTPDDVAIERNGAIIPCNLFATCTLSEGDALEIVTFIGGG